MQIIIVRHCQTLANRKRMCQQQIIGSLSTQGKKQSKKLALALKNEKIDIIYSSDSERTLETAKEITKFHRVPLIIDKSIREKNLGEFIGKSRAEFYGAVKKSGIPRIKFRPKGGESYEDILKRAEKFVKRILRKKDRNILIITHGGMVKMFTSILLKRPVKEFINMSPHNAGISIFESQSRTFRAVKIDSFNHLKK